MKKLISAVLLITLVFMTIVPISASEITPYYNGVSSGIAMLSFSKWGIAVCTTTFTLRSTLIEADVEMQLLRYETTGWTEVKTWNEHFGPSTDKTIVLDKRYAVPENGIYKVVAIADITTSSGKDHLEPYSNNIEYP